ncbi:hypothetical protein [Candidatus Sneabacter namystus]|uniref:Uncharacterized protein n=1 Tax=Candidatus Sneabacter namystus TaxID=2601646 RepID=A0A5C0UHZ7_9RICK|nr:hypothetical protein [Candidatus Sneabacter namystus]QEK39360.1 hypothetical protein FZC37_00145 [Candidatus Sneabacter namystus]
MKRSFNLLAKSAKREAVKVQEPKWKQKVKDSPILKGLEDCNTTVREKDFKLLKTLTKEQYKDEEVLKYIDKKNGGMPYNGSKTTPIVLMILQSFDRDNVALLKGVADKLKSEGALKEPYPDIVVSALDDMYCPEAYTQSLDTLYHIPCKQAKCTETVCSGEHSFSDFCPEQI